MAFFAFTFHQQNVSIKMKRLITLILTLCIFANINAQDVQVQTNPEHNIIQLALLLDVSNSMDGLIDQAKSELWTIVNEVAKAKKNGHSTQLEIALYEYGRSNGDLKNGYVTKLLDYTSDLDTISLVLFGLKTNGGDEYCGWVIKDALEELQWRGSDSIYRVIFIAGNEPFNQGTVDYKNSCTNAYEKGIFINTIHCGDSFTGVSTFWKNGADMGKGDYFFINHNSKGYDIVTPYDSLMGVYNDSINVTYWSFGNNKEFYISNQREQDNNAMKMSKSVKAKRAVSKTTKVYDNSKWDAVDASKKDTAWLSKVKEEELPDKMKGKSVTEKKMMVDSLAKERSRISKNISDLNMKREAYIKETASKSKERTLGAVLVEAIHRQAGLKGFKFD